MSSQIITLCVSSLANIKSVNKASVRSEREKMFIRALSI